MPSPIQLMRHIFPPIEWPRKILFPLEIQRFEVSPAQTDQSNNGKSGVRSSEYNNVYVCSVDDRELGSALCLPTGKMFNNETFTTPCKFCVLLCDFDSFALRLHQRSAELVHITAWHQHSRRRRRRLISSFMTYPADAFHPFEFDGSGSFLQWQKFTCTRCVILCYILHEFLLAAHMCARRRYYHSFMWWNGQILQVYGGGRKRGTLAFAFAEDYCWHYISVVQANKGRSF